MAFVATASADISAKIVVPKPCSLDARYGSPMSASGSHRQDAVLAPGPLDVLGAGDLEPLPDGEAGVGRVDDGVDGRVAGSDVRIDVLAELLGQLHLGLASLLRVLVLVE